MTPEWQKNRNVFCSRLGNLHSQLLLAIGLRPSFCKPRLIAGFRYFRDSMAICSNVSEIKKWHDAGPKNLLVGEYDMGLQPLQVEAIHRQFKGSFTILHDPFCTWLQYITVPFGDAQYNLEQRRTVTSGEYKQIICAVALLAWLWCKTWKLIGLSAFLDL